MHHLVRWPLPNSVAVAAILPAKYRGTNDNGRKPVWYCHTHSPKASGILVLALPFGIRMVTEYPTEEIPHLVLVSPAVLI
jgi:hypothetical protein